MRKDIKNTTESVRRRHIWRSFSVRIEQVQIDVGRRIERIGAIEEQTESYFVTGLHKWSELNLTIPFTEFLQQVDKKAKTLAQIVHHQGDIFDALMTGISKGDPLSLDAVLDLLVQFIRDLQVDFESYVPRTIATLVPLTRNASVEVIEATFTTFAYLFKYLYKPLSANPIPVFDAFAVLLARDGAQKQYIVRFAAESLSFLLRRTRSQAQQDFLQHVTQDLQSQSANVDYEEGISYLLAEVIKGVDHSLHAKGVAFFNTFLQLMTRHHSLITMGNIVNNVLENVTINLLHHCTRESFSPILALYTELILSEDQFVRDLGWRMCFISVAVRKGTRVEDWTQLLVFLKDSLSPSVSRSAWNAAHFASALYTYAPHATILPLSAQILTGITDLDGTAFLSFSEIVAKQNLVNFVTFVLPAYRKYLNESWTTENERKMMRSVINLSKLGAFQDESSSAQNGRLKLSDRINQLVSDSIAAIDPSKTNQSYARTLVQISGVLYGHDQFVSANLALLDKCTAARRTVSTTRLFGLLMGSICEQLARSQLDDKFDPSELLKSAGLWRSSGFLKGYAALSTRHQLKNTTATTTGILLTNLSSPGHFRRLYSLQILQTLDLAFSDVDRDLLSVCEIVESTDLTIDATRALAMQIRKLNQNYPLLTNRTSQLAIVHFSMGLMTGNYTPFWSFCSETLGVVARTDAELVWNLAQAWFDGTGCNPEERESVVEASKENLLVREAKQDSFRCFNTAELRQNCVDAKDSLLNAECTAQVAYLMERDCEDETSSVSRRSQAMRIFSAIPEVAEKHTRHLVPVFLTQFGSSASDDDDDFVPEPQISASEHIETARPTEHITSGISSDKFNKRERNELLTLFTKFSNPAAFWQSNSVRELTMDLLASRDSRTQNLAFTIILNYKDPGLKRYEDNLRNLLSDERSRDEITTFLQTDSDDTSIQDEYRKDVIAVVSRILYGRMISRRHASSQKKGLANSRNIILGAVASLPSDDIGEFVSLFLKTFRDIDVVDKSESTYSIGREVDLKCVTLRKQVGFCTMLQDAAEQLAGKMLPFIGGVLDALIYCFLSATDVLDTTMDTEDNKVSLKIARNIRHSVYQCLEMFFRYCRNYDWKPYLVILFNHFINPRLDKLPIESSQNPSGLLKLFGTWASSPVTSPLLVEHNHLVLNKIFDCLAEKSLKDSVAIFVLKIVESLSEQVEDETVDFLPQTRKALLEDKVEIFLDSMAILLSNQQVTSTNNTINSDFLDLEIAVLSSISKLVHGGPAIQKLLDLLMPLLQKPRKLVADMVKEDILRIVENFLPLSEDYRTCSDSLWKRYNAVGGLFSTCSSRKSRSSLSNIMRIFAAKDESLLSGAGIIDDLNSFSKRRLDTPDFDRRLAAFATLNEQLYDKLAPKAWRPVLHNMIFFVGDEEELALRTNAVYGIRRFLEVTKRRETDGQDLFLRSLETDLYPAIKKGMRHRTEIIRQEWVAILGSVVKDCSFWPQVADMEPLLVGDDEEANFFNNILHIQQHRRMRALRRLASISQKHELLSNNIAQVILPLIEHYCFAPREESHNLIAETIKTIGQLASSLRFNQYCALLKRYIGLLKPSENTQATVVRLIGAVADALVGQSEVATDLVDYLHEEEELSDTQPVLDVAMIEGDQKTTPDTSQDTSLLKQSCPAEEKVHNTITTSFLPQLTKYLHSKDDDTINLRIPIAVTVVKLLAALPHEALTMKLPGVLTDICHVLRSRSQDARDMTRKTLGSISTLLGPKYFSYILAELKAALQRGYQLHVLGFSIHTILVKIEPEYGSLDYCLSQIVDMLIDDIFGETGLEKDAEEYISKMKEMKSTKSYDSFEILASCTRLSSLGEVLWPLRTLLAETSSLKIIRKVDEIFRRLTLGILRNSACDSRDSLLFCYNIYQQTVSSTQEKTARVLSIQEQARKDAEKNFVVNLKARSVFVRDHFKANAHKLLKFSLETLRTILHRHPQLQTAENLAAFIPMIGDSLMCGYEDVHISALRLLSQIIKLDLNALDAGAPVFLEQAVSFIKASPSTKTEICQASLKFISTILKERKNVTVKDSVLAYLLVRIKADIEEPDRQGVTFSILRSIMSRKFMVPELYDIMDEVKNMMVTNQSAGPRDTARSAYYQFLLDYPQGKGRLKAQMTFLVKNLEYVHSSGRKSVMEALHLIASNFDDSILQEYIMTFYFALTMALINDDDSNCREMAATLIKKLIARADQERLSSMVAALKSWSYNDQKVLQRAALQGFGLLFEVKSNRKDDMRFFMDKLQAVLGTSATEEDETAMDDDETGREPDIHWQLIYYGLQTFGRILADYQTTYISLKYSTLWSNIQKLLLYRHAWIRLSASRLIGSLFASRLINDKLYLVAGKDLEWQPIVLVRIARQSLIQLRSPLLSEDLGTQITKNLIFLLRFFHEKGTMLPPREDQEDAGDNDDQADETAASTTCVSWLIQRVATLLQSDRDVKRETTTLVRRLLLQFMTLSVRLLPNDQLTSLAHTMIRPLYKYSTAAQSHPQSLGQSSSTAPAPSSLRDISEDILATLNTKLGTTIYSQAYAAVRMQQQDLRLERRQKRIMESVKDPELGAAKRVKRSLKKREKRAEVAGSNKRHREMRG